MDFPLRDITSAAPDRAGARPVWGSAENRLVSVSGAVTASFAYDGDGKRVKSTIAGMTTYFVGNIYEQTGSTVTKYYYLGGKRVAMRQGSSVYYLLSDHLGSTTVTTDVNGAVVAELRYKPWGEVRYTGGNTPTKYTFTGQYSNTTDFGLMFYNARWYDPALGRMAQADTIVPDPSDPQALDRYAYTLNNPVRYTDPSGHCIQVEDGFCLRKAKSGGYRIVHAERERFANRVERALADFILSGETAALNGINSTEALFISAALEGACAGLGKDCGNSATKKFWILAAMTGGFGGAYPPAGIGPGVGGSIPRGGMMGDPDCVGCGYTFTPRTTKQALEPGGYPIWTVTGRDPSIGTLRNERQIRAIFGALSVDGTPANRPGFKGTQYDLPGGGWVGLRESTDFGPTIELKIPGIQVETLHLPFP